jgi:hypothetical protein
MSFWSSVSTRPLDWGSPFIDFDLRRTEFIPFSRAE